mgnify:CR=1 FL=1
MRFIGERGIGRVVQFAPVPVTLAALGGISRAALAGGAHGGRVVAEAGSAVSEFYRYLVATRFIYLAVSLAFLAWLLGGRTASRRRGSLPASPHAFNLLELPWFGRLARSRWYLPLFQIPTLLVFVAVLYFGFRGPPDASRNPATVLTWIIWWPGLVLLILLLGRIWCLMCPFGSLGDAVQRRWSLQLKLPRPLRNLWGQVLIFQVLTWAFLYWQIDARPRATAWLLAVLALAAMAVAALFERRSFCRYLCPIGGLIGLYSTVSPLELRVKSREVCRSHQGRDCVVGNERGRACPMLEFPGNLDRNVYCNLCLECVKACPLDNLRLSLRPPGKDLWTTAHRQADETAAVAILWGITLLEALLMARWGGRPGLISYTALYLGTTMGLPLTLLGAAAFLGGGGKWKEGLKKLGYTLVPLGLAMHLAHNLEHLLVDGPLLVAAWESARETLGLGGSPMAIAPPLVRPTTLFYIQLFTLLAGLLVSLQVGTRLLGPSPGPGEEVGPDSTGLHSRPVSRARLAPMWGAIALFSALNYYALGLPMGSRASVVNGAAGAAGGYPLLFISNRDGNREVYRVNPDGSNLARLTHTPEEEEEASWSPDGSLIVTVARDEEGDQEIYVMKADGTGRRKLTDNRVDDWSPIWSPDGGRIAYVQGIGEQAEIMVVERGGINAVQVTRNRYWDYVRSWTADGTRLLYESVREGQMDIYLARDDGTGETNLTNHPANDGDPAWSPDGRWIAFSSDRDGNQEIYLMKADGTRQRRVTRSPSWEGHPYWSPDSSKILFESDRGPGGTFEVMAVYPNGARERNLTGNPANDKHPAWSPDGSMVAYVSDRDGNMEIYVANADGSEPRNITASRANDMFPSW